MNYLKQIASDASTSAYMFFNQGMQKTREWGGHVVRYLQQIPQTLEQHPIAAIAAIATINLVVLCILNNGMKRLLSKQGEEEKLFSKQGLITDAVVLGVSVGLNTGLSKITKLDPVLVGIISIANVIARHVPKFFPAAQKANTENKEVNQVSPSDDVESALSTAENKETPQKEGTQTNSPPKPLLQTAQQKSELAKLKLEIAKETERADKIQSEKSVISRQIAELESQIADLQSEKTAVEQNYQDEQARSAKALHEANRLESARQQLESEKLDLDTKLGSLNNDLTNATKAKNRAEQDLADLKAAKQIEIETLEKEIETLSSSLDAATTKQTGLNQNLDALTQAKDSLDTANTQLKTDVADLRQRVTTLEGENTQLLQQIKKIKLLEDDILALVDEKKALEDKVAHKDRMITLLRVRNTADADKLKDHPTTDVSGEQGSPLKPAKGATSSSAEAADTGTPTRGARPTQHLGRASPRSLSVDRNFGDKVETPFRLAGFGKGGTARKAKD